MTHNANDRPKFYPLKREAGWLFHNCVHPLVGVLGFTAALLHHTGSKTIAPVLLGLGDRLHDWSLPEETDA